MFKYTRNELHKARCTVQLMVCEEPKCLTVGSLILRDVIEIQIVFLGLNFVFDLFQRKHNLCREISVEHSTLKVGSSHF